MLVKRSRKVCTCVTLAIFTTLTIFIMRNPIICLVRNFTGYLRYTQSSISLGKQFFKPKVYAARAFKVCTYKCLIFDYLLFCVCSLVWDEVLPHAILSYNFYKWNKVVTSKITLPCDYEGARVSTPPRGFVVTFGRWQAPWPPREKKVLGKTRILFFTSSKNIIPSRSYRTLKIAYILWLACRPYTSRF